MKKDRNVVDDQIYTEFDYENHNSILDRIIKKAKKFVGKIKKKQKVYTFAEKRNRKKISRKNANNPLYTTKNEI